jgi:hypothetical protein
MMDERRLELWQCIRFSNVVHYSINPILNRAEKARGDWSNKDIAIVKPNYT